MLKSWSTKSPLCLSLDSISLLSCSVGLTQTAEASYWIWLNFCTYGHLSIVVSKRSPKYIWGHDKSNFYISLKYLIQSTFVIFSVSLLFKKTDIMVNRPFVNLRSGVWQPSAGVYLHPRKQCFWLVISLSRYTETLIMSRDITGSEPICSAARPGRRAETISQGE